MEKKGKYVKGLYCFSLLSWILNICFIIMQFFIEISMAWIIVFFASIIIQGIASGAFGDETAIPNVKIKRKFLDYCINISVILSVVITAISGISLLIAGGGPEIINDTYCVVNHGDVVREISSPYLFFFLCICDFMLFNCVILIFSSLIALRIRKIYLFPTLLFSDEQINNCL